MSNPHSLTGTALPMVALRRFLEAGPDEVCVVLDEAYLEYAPAGTIDGVALGREHWASGRTNLAITRTFSKAHALAAERVGYMAAPPAIARAWQDRHRAHIHR